MSFFANSETCPWSNTALPIEERTQLLLKASTLHQKYRWLVEQPANEPIKISFTAFMSELKSSYPPQVACTPFVQFIDTAQGVRDTSGATAFPAPISLAATWDENLSEAQGHAIAYEAWHKRKNVALAPAIASGRTPLSGRTSEYLGEDPILSGVLSGYMTKGLQEGNSGKNVVAVLKHFVGNEQETDRSDSSSNILPRAYHEIYTLPFAISMSIAEPGGVMCAYNQVNGIYSCENDSLLNGTLKGDFNFDGFVVSDFLAVHSVAPSLKAGLDQELNAPLYFTPEKLDAAMASGEITEADIDKAASRVINTYIKLGLFDNLLPEKELENVSTAANKALALRMAEEGSVLLKNKANTLPIKSTKQTIAVIGPTASNELTNGVSAKTVCSATFKYSSDGMTVACPNPIAALDAIIVRAAQDKSTVVFNNGADLNSAAALAENSDIVIVFGYYIEGEFADRANLSLDNGGDALISAVAAKNSNTIVLLQTGSAVLMPWLKDVEAVIETWYAGEQQGLAVANLLWGDTNPSGKLPMTFPKKENQTPTSLSTDRFPGIMDKNGIRQVAFDEGILVGYRWYDAMKEQPLFPFGFGLSYTTFSYSQMNITPVSLFSHQATKVNFVLSNTGTRAGTEIAQVYVSLPANLGEAPQRLIGWKKIHLNAGGSQKVSIDIDLSAATKPFSYWHEESSQWQVAKGNYIISVGSSSRELTVVGNVEIK